LSLSRRVFLVLLVISVGVNAWLISRRSGMETNRRPQAESPTPRAGGQAAGGAEEHVVGERQDLIGSVERDWLRRAGFPAPAESLRADLLRHPELIPAEGVLGGTMAFRPDAIYLLPGGHVWAIADDGHIESAVLLRYSVERDTTVRWNVVYHREP
jgi:hypothetical protein